MIQCKRRKVARGSREAASTCKKNPLKSVSEQDRAEVSNTRTIASQGDPEVFICGRNKHLSIYLSLLPSIASDPYQVEGS
jgi:hypothetical protein